MIYTPRFWVRLPGVLWEWEWDGGTAGKGIGLGCEGDLWKGKEGGLLMWKGIERGYCGGEKVRLRRGSEVRVKGKQGTG